MVSLDGISNLGPHAFVADANGYPYMRTMLDGQGRVIRQSGVGETHRIGAGHDIYTVYAGVTQKELDRLFGTEVGYAQHYSKTIVRDANGQYAATYSDLQGRTIATSLIGEAPESVDALDSMNEQAMQTLELEQSVYNAQDHSLDLSWSFFVPLDNTTISLDYSIDPGTLSSLCGEEEPTCRYLLTITVQDECQNVVGTPVTEWLDATTSEVEGPVEFELGPAGSYTIHKRLQLDASIIYQAAAELEQALTEALTTWLNGGSAPDTEFPCIDWPEYEEPDWSDCVDCEEECLEEPEGEGCAECQEIESPCIALYEAIAEDMSPGGQYFDNLSVNEVEIYEPNAWLDENVVPFSTITDGWEYDNGNGNQEVTSWDDVRENWQAEWLEELIFYHPEYCLYEVCLKTECAQMYELYLLSISTFAEAETLGLISETDQTEIFSSDPTFNEVEGYECDELDNVSSAETALFNALDDHVYWDDGLEFFGDPTPPLSTEELDGLWIYVRGRYLCDRNEFFEAALDEWIEDCEDALNSPATLPLPESSEEVGSWEDPSTDNFYVIQHFNYSMTCGESLSDFNDFFGDIADELGIPFDAGTFDLEDFLGDLADQLDEMTSADCGSAPWVQVNYYRPAGDEIQIWIFKPGDSGIMISECFDISDLEGVQLFQLIADEVNNYSATPPNIEFEATVIEDGENLSLLIYSNTGTETLNGFQLGYIDCETIPIPSPSAFGTTPQLLTPGEVDEDCDEAMIMAQACGCQGISATLNAMPLPFDLADGLESISATLLALFPSGIPYDNGASTYTLPSDIGEILWATCQDEEVISPPPAEALITLWHTYCPAPVMANELGCQDNNESLSLAQYNQLSGAQVLIQQIVQEFIANHIASCFLEPEAGTFEEHFTLTIPDFEYHYTLYYYDQAGSLVRTVPPEGVEFFTEPEDLEDVADARNQEPPLVVVPPHTMVTRYRYDSFMQLVDQDMPDMNNAEAEDWDMRFFYDRLGRLRASQNSKQAGYTPPGFSYVRYDPLGRPLEAGQVTATDAPTYAELNSEEFPFGIGFTSDTHGTEVVYTVYDASPDETPDTDDDDLHNAAADAAFSSTLPRHLRGRVAGSWFSESGPRDEYTHASHYSYDAHGNVQELVQEHAVLADLGHDLKKTEYRYDLISGQVKSVAYQRGETDQFMHRYSYDAESRLILAETSHDGLIWERDAKYFYYLHGPLSRMEIGHDKVQGLDYAYTIHGWLKGVNSAELGAEEDMGRDGSAEEGGYSTDYDAIHRSVARDAYGYVLNYYEDDYNPIGSHSFTTGLSAVTNLGDDLFNGNIRSMATTLAYDQLDPGDLPDGVSDVLLGIYRYDQLNRLLNVEAWTGNQGESTSAYASLANDGDWHEEYTYDANGNIKTLLRHGHDILMDDLVYYYQTGLNRLDYVDDDETTAGIPNDIESGQTTGNYDYDALGNLTADELEDIDVIKWTLSGKVDRVIKPDIELAFAYDAAGQRTRKEVWYDDLEDSHITWYMRDAQGNVLATYVGTYSDHDTEEETAVLTIALEEQYLYGSGRLGSRQGGVLGSYQVSYTSYTKSTGLVGAEHTLDEEATLEDLGHRRRTIRQKRYELTNHLGNVLAVVTDRRIPEGEDDEVTGYSAEILILQDYTPFGTVNHERQAVVSDAKYRFGFQGQESDREYTFDEAEGSASLSESYLAFTYRVHDARIGRFLSVDPLSAKYPYNSTYAFAENKLGLGVELEGTELLIGMDSRAIRGLMEGKSLIQIANDEVLFQKGVSDAIISNVQGAFYLVQLGILESNYWVGNSYKISLTGNPEFDPSGSPMYQMLRSLNTDQLVQAFESAGELIEKAFEGDAYANGRIAGEILLMMFGIEEAVAKIASFEGRLSVYALDDIAGVSGVVLPRVEITAEKVVKEAVGNASSTGTTVLGKYPDYINLAGKLGAKRFSIPTNIWNKMTAAEQWAANTKFLDEMIARGDKIVLSNRVTDMSKVTGAFRKELDYLIGKGYRISSDGLQMIK